MAINAVGAIATGLTVLMVIVAKFSEGAWITLIAIPGFILLMYRVRSHYDKMWREIGINTPLEPTNQLQPVMVIAMQAWTRVGKDALHFAMTLSKDIKVLHVTEEDKPDEFCNHWQEYIQDPAEKANLPVPELVDLKSPYSFVVTPIVEYIGPLAHDNPNRRVVAVIPELMERRWYYYFLHTQRAALLKTRLLMEGNNRVSVLNIPWYLKAD
jgi:hypothetical protein